MSALMSILVCGLLIGTVLALATGLLYVVRAVQAWLRGDGFRGFCCSALALLLIGAPSWLWACVWAARESAHEAAACSLNLSRVVYPAALEYRLRHPGAPLPAHWPGIEREPMCKGAGTPQPYAYVPVADLGKAAEAAPATWLAHCPGRHRSFWWLPGVLRSADRVVLEASGQARPVSEEEFQEHLRRARERPPTP